MKMDRVSFAALIGYLTFHGLDHSFQTIETIDNMIDINVPAPLTPVKAPVLEVDTLMKAIKADSKIEAIKTYRTLTGAGLKESKDAVEAHAFFPPRGMYKTAEKLKTEMLATITSQQNDELDRYVLRDFSNHDLDTIKDFIRSFSVE